MPLDARTFSKTCSKRCQDGLNHNVNTGDQSRVEEQAVESCAETTVKRRCESWSDCALSAGKRVCAHLRAQGHLDQVEELLLSGLLQGPHVEPPLTGWRICQICFTVNVDHHLQVNLVFVQPGYKTLDFGHEFWALG